MDTPNPDTPVGLTRHGSVLVATIDNPPVNALSHAVRAGLVEAIDQLEASPDLAALVILCAGKTFIAGADLREFGKLIKEPRLGTVIQRLDRCEKPVVAALHGTALGGGLEVALACSYRIAQAQARMGLPEVKLGILPGAGGTVRLPRLVGIETALTMISEGQQVDAGAAREAGLVDEIAGADLAADALAYAERIVADGARIRRTSALPVPAVEPGFFERKRTDLARRFKGLDAPRIAVDLVEAMTTKPFAEAEAHAYDVCRGLVTSPQSRALRHLFAAERAAQKIDGVGPDVAPREIRRVAVVGPGTMGRGIATCLVNAGLSVTLVGLDEEGLGRARSAVRKSYDGALKRGAITEDAVEERLSRLATTVDYAPLSSCDLAIEAVTEDLDTKRAVFARLEAALPDHAIIATNTSFLDIEALADAGTRPERVAGMHFFNPANVMKLLENVRGRRTAPDVLATITALGKKLGKIPVMVGRSEGFVANRMLSKRSREAQFLLEDGATPQQVDRVLTGFGFPIGPFALADLAGIDVMCAARAARFARMTRREQDCDILDTLKAAGRLGQKNGVGYYRYGEDRKPQHDPAVDELLEAHRKRRGRPRRAVSDEEILERCLYAMINEAALILDEGAAARPGDIDVIWTSGFGWPAHLGGPMFHADEVGLPALRDALDRYSRLVGDEYFTPAPLIDRLVAEGHGFYG